MKMLTKTLVLLGGLALTTSFGCAKSDSETSSEPVAGDVQGLAQESLLVLKFHHDN